MLCPHGNKRPQQDEKHDRRKRGEDDPNKHGGKRQPLEN
jgi:hypothetical protein